MFHLKHSSDFELFKKHLCIWITHYILFNKLNKILMFN